MNAEHKQHHSEKEKQALWLLGCGRNRKVSRFGDSKRTKPKTRELLYAQRRDKEKKNGRQQLFAIVGLWTLAHDCRVGLRLTAQYSFWGGWVFLKITQATWYQLKWSSHFHSLWKYFANAFQWPLTWNLKQHSSFSFDFSSRKMLPPFMKANNSKNKVNKNVYVYSELKASKRRNLEFDSKAWHLEKRRARLITGGSKIC